MSRRRPSGSACWTVRHESAFRLFERCRAEGRSALIGTCRRVPRRADVDLGDDGHGRIRLRHHRSRDRVLRSGDGRPVIAAATEAALRGGVGCVTRWRRSRRSARPAAGRGDDLLESGVALGCRRVRSRPGLCGWLGMITPDLIPDEADEWLAVSERTRSGPIFLVAPSSTPERLAATVRRRADSSTPLRQWGDGCT
jgi:tryptophan synthase alpha chain